MVGRCSKPFIAANFGACRCPDRGERRLSIWSHYQDRTTGEWKPCGGKREAPGFIVPPEEADDLQATLTALADELRSRAA